MAEPAKKLACVELTVNEKVWSATDDLLGKTYQRIRENSTPVMGGSNCRVCTFAVCSPKTPYPVLKVAGQTAYAHNVVAMVKWRRAGNSTLWSKDLQVSHDCHNTKCVDISHLSVISGEENRAKTGCKAKLVCDVCARIVHACRHEPKCLTVAPMLCEMCMN